MDPAVVALLNYEEDPEIIFYGLDLQQFEYIIIPINDNSKKMSQIITEEYIENLRFKIKELIESLIKKK